MKSNKPKQNIALNMLKFLKVIFKIAEVLMIFATFCVAIGMLAILIIGTQLKLSDGTLSFAGEKITYKVNEDNNFEISYNGYNFALNEEDLDMNLVELNAEELVELLDNLNLTKLIVIAELVMFISIVGMMFTYYELKHYIAVLTNTIKVESPFVDENPGELIAAFKLLIYELLVMIVLAIMVAVISDGNVEVNIPYAGLEEIIIVYVLAWVIDKGNAKKSVKTEKVETKKVTTKKTTKKK